MRYMVLPFLLCVHFMSVLAVTVLEGEAAAPRNLGSRKLSAASRPSKIQPRSDSFSLSKNVEFLYADDNYNGVEESSMAATVRVGSDRPILVLEEIEHLLYNVECSSDSIEISTWNTMEKNMREQLHSLHGGHIITSHISCNDAAGRQAYRVLKTTQTTESTMTMDILAVSWRDKDSFTSFSISLGREPTSTYALRNQPQTTAAPDLSKRAGTAYDSSNFSFAEAPAFSSIASSSVPSTPPTGDSHSFDLANIGPFINQQYGLNWPGTLNPAPVAVGCVNCTFWGIVDLQFANFDVSIESESVSGTATLTAQGVGAHLALKTVLTDTWYFTFPLGPSLTYALDIHGMAEVRFGVGEYIAGGYEMTGKVGMEYGFDMSVPPSSLTLDIGDPTASTETGWGNTGFTALPFNSQLEIQALDLWLALRTAASIELFVEGHPVGAAGAYVDVPRLDAKVTPVSDVDVNCNPITSSTDNADSDRSILTSPIKVDVSGSYDYGAYTRGTFVPDLSHFEKSNTIPVQQMCLNFDSSTQSYSTADQAVNGKGAILPPPSISVLTLVIACAVIIVI